MLKVQVTNQLFFLDNNNSQFTGACKASFVHFNWHL